MKMFLSIVLICFFFQDSLTSEAVNGTVTGCDGYPCSIGAKKVAPVTSDLQEAIILSRCHAMCMDIFAMEFGISSIRNHSQWPAVSLSALKNRTCLYIIMLDDCKRGCFIRNTVANSTRRSCRTQCNGECNQKVQQNCGGDFPCSIIPNFPTCPNVQCYETGCKSGCNTPLQPNRQNSAPSPLSPINLMSKTMPLQDPGLFEVGPYNVPQDSTSPTLNLFVFLLQVNTSTGSYYYLKDTITNGTLDLGYFACQATNISFSAVSAIGATDFSPPSSVCIHGGTRYPVFQPNSLNYTVSLDPTPGEETIAVIHLSWTKPTEFHLVTGYEITAISTIQTCEHAPIHVINIDRKMTSAAIRSTKLSCRYNITLLAFPRGISSTVQISVDTDPNTFLPRIIQTCSYDANKKTGVISVKTTWTLENTLDTPIVLKATKDFEVTTQLISYIGDFPVVDREISQDNVPASANVSAVYTYETGNIQPLTGEAKQVRIIIYPQRRLDIPYQDYIEHVLCVLKPEPFPPSAVNSSSIIVENFMLTSTSSGILYLTMIWDEPNKPYGQIEIYQIRILRFANSTNEIAKRENVSSGQEIVEHNIYIDKDVVCLYAQIRARNQYSWGAWSESVSLLLYPETNPNCKPAVPTEPHPPATIPIIVGVSDNVEVGLGAGIGSVVALLSCIAMLSVMICLLKRYRMKRQMKRVFETGYPTPIFLATKDAHDTNSLRLPLSLTYPTIEMDEWEIPVGTVIVESKFGEGCFGEVHRGVVRGPIPTSKSMKANICVAVAIKMLKNTATGSERTDFIREIETMKKVAEGNNPHVINFIGCVTTQEPLCLITEFVKYGDLLSYLETIRKLVTHKNRQKRMAKLMADLSKEPEPYLEPHSQDQYEEFPLSGAAAAVQYKPEFGKDITGDKVVPTPGTLYAELGGVEPVNLISFAYQIAYGMEYLASIDVVHRDLACRNILIGEHKTLKISDFGMSRFVTGEDIYVKTTKGRLPWKWMAIESIVDREFTHASDVWAYGVTIWEIATLGGFPYPTVSNADLLDHLKKGYRLECPENCSSEVYQVMAGCWNEYPDERRTFTDLRSIFDAMLAEDSPYIQFENINGNKPYYNVGSRRNTKCEGEDVIANLSESEIEFESSTSTVTLNGASVNGGVYDNLIPLLSRDTPPSDIEEPQSYNLHIANQYVDTPTTFKSLEQDEENTQTTEIIVNAQ